jgi:membrane AbrB-like protein
MRPALVLFALSGLFVALLEWIAIPAAPLLGSMLAAALLAIRGAEMKIPFPAFALAQATIGCMIARGIPPTFFGSLLHSWPVFLGGTLWAMIAAAVMGGLLTRLRILPGTSAIWGSSPGAASAMIVIAEHYGADIRLVAFMQYLRLACVALAASLVAHASGAASGIVRPGAAWLEAPAWPAFPLTLALIAACIGMAKLFRLSGGPLLLSMSLGILLNALGWLHPELPPWFLAACFTIMGWTIGLRFTRRLLLPLLHSLPWILGTIVLLMIFCALFGGLLVAAAGMDPLTAYLATCPGGLDTVAIIAASTPTVDTPFVMTMQTARMLLVICTGPRLARFVAQKALPPAARAPSRSR